MKSYLGASPAGLLVGSLWIGALFAAGVPRALAQEDQEGTEEPEEPEAKGPTGKVGPEKGAAQPQVSEIHQVQGGDTLWDLCSKYLNSPWYWPKIWSYNPQITNPHWIYPGNELRFYPSDENLPTNVEVSSKMTIPQGDQEGDDTAIPDSVAEEDLVRTVGTLQVGRTPPNSY